MGDQKKERPKPTTGGMGLLPPPPSKGSQNTTNTGSINIAPPSNGKKLTYKSQNYNIFTQKTPLKSGTGWR